MQPVFAFLVLLITAPLQLPETVLTARIVGITDGDTVRALTNDNQLMRARLRTVLSITLEGIWWHSYCVESIFDR
jgi:hypothetical protein